jgi:hypothetical protein
MGLHAMQVPNRAQCKRRGLPLRTPGNRKDLANSVCVAAIGHATEIDLSFAENASAGIALRCRAFVTVMESSGGEVNRVPLEISGTSTRGAGRFGTKISAKR